jgi:hypothetical protein
VELCKKELGIIPSNKGAIRNNASMSNNKILLMNLDQDAISRLQSMGRASTASPARKKIEEI